MMGLTRPSYVHVRRYVVAHRASEDAVREVVTDVLGRLVVGRGVDPYIAGRRVREARALDASNSRA